MLECGYINPCIVDTDRDLNARASSISQLEVSGAHSAGFVYWGMQMLIATLAAVM